MAATKSAAESGTAKPKSKTARKASRAAAKPSDAIELLKDDHKEVKGYFSEYEKLEEDAEKQTLAECICTARTVHAQIEEEIFWTRPRSSTQARSS